MKTLVLLLFAFAFCTRPFTNSNTTSFPNFSVAEQTATITISSPLSTKLSFYIGSFLFSIRKSNDLSFIYNDVKECALKTDDLIQIRLLSIDSILIVVSNSDCLLTLNTSLLGTMEVKKEEGENTIELDVIYQETIPGLLPELKGTLERIKAVVDEGKQKNMPESAIATHINQIKEHMRTLTAEISPLRREGHDLEDHQQSLEDSLIRIIKLSESLKYFRTTKMTMKYVILGILVATTGVLLFGIKKVGEWRKNETW